MSSNDPEWKRTLLGFSLLYVRHRSFLQQHRLKASDARAGDVRKRGMALIVTRAHMAVELTLDRIV